MLMPFLFINLIGMGIAHNCDFARDGDNLTFLSKDKSTNHFYFDAEPWNCNSVMHLNC